MIWPSDQCDQMTKLCFKYLRIFSNEICPKAYKLCQRELKTLPKTKQTLNMLPRIFKCLTKRWNFAKSGHTGSDQF